MATWTNPDGLLVLYGTDAAKIDNGGEYRNDGVYRLTEIGFNLAPLTTTAAQVSRVKVGKGIVVEKVEVVADVAATSGGSATLDIGLLSTDGTTVNDDDGLVAALPLANINVVGETNTLTAGVSLAGALVGTTLSSADGYMHITASYNTAAFTAGNVKLRLYWRKRITEVQ